MSEKAQKIYDAYSKQLWEDQNSTTVSALSSAIREVVEQYTVGNMMYCSDILKLADDLEELWKNT
jgi:hypothetical protein